MTKHICNLEMEFYIDGEKQITGLVQRKIELNFTPYEDLSIELGSSHYGYFTVKKVRFNANTNEFRLFSKYSYINCTEFNNAEYEGKSSHPKIKGTQLENLEMTVKLAKRNGWNILVTSEYCPEECKEYHKPKYREEIIAKLIKDVQERTISHNL